jgi:cell division protein ZapA (FtsZ GTPase activity inhibitor)
MGERLRSGSIIKVTILLAVQVLLRLAMLGEDSVSYRSQSGYELGPYLQHTRRLQNALIQYTTITVLY